MNQPHKSHKMVTERHPNHNLDYCDNCGLSENSDKIKDQCGVSLTDLKSAFTNADEKDWAWLLNLLKYIATEENGSKARGEAKFWLALMTDIRRRSD